MSFLRQLKLVPVITFCSLSYVINNILARPDLTISAPIRTLTSQKTLILSFAHRRYN
jgi:hypothetical protein